MVNLSHVASSCPNGRRALRLRQNKCGKNVEQCYQNRAGRGEYC